MVSWIRSLQIGFTFIGTVVGAGFATGREVMQFFTRFGHWGVPMIAVATALFVWLGARTMLISARIGARSYEDLNRHLFGDRWGVRISRLMLVVLLGANAVMLAGAGTIFSEQLGLNYELGLLVTAVGCFVFLRRGMSGILAINTAVVPLMAAFGLYIVFRMLGDPPGSLEGLAQRTDASLLGVGLSPFLYAAYNLTMAQTVLAPLGSAIRDPRTIRRGAAVGGIGIGLMLLAGHVSMSARMPDIARYEIPIGGIAQEIGGWIHSAYVLIVFLEIFTTLVSDQYGIALQLTSRFHWPQPAVSAGLLAVCFAAGQFGFGTLLSVLYPLFGVLCLGWMFQIGSARASP
ncbi:MAG: hypothetical protein BAA02_10135 [Paenibacillaceae bacterium ZCTH02-B3]|nr:MAG: hypothetical protein BAA02_10135 [Paenibacillaceae bacterium ZCTH02-B3]